jgi:penicillin-binding protein 1A
MDFISQVKDGMPGDQFKPPANAKFAMVRGILEAFRPGTEPTLVDQTLGAAGPISGPQPYDQVFGNGLTGAPNAAAAVQPPPPKKRDDLSDLF